MHSKSGNLEQIKSLLNRQINQTHQIQFSAMSIKHGNNESRNYKQAQSGIGNFTDMQELTINTPKQKFIQINQEPELQSAEYEIKGFWSKNKNNNSSSSMINQYVKKPYYHHQKSKSSTTMPRHVSIMMTNEDASCCSRGNNNAISDMAPSTGKGSPNKKQTNGVSAMSQISLFFHDASNMGDNMTTFYTNNANNNRPETVQTSHSRKIITPANRYQNNNEDADDKTISIQSPQSHHHRVLSASISNPSVNTAYFSCLRSNSNNAKQNVRPHSQNTQKISRSPTNMQRPLTAVNSNIKQERSDQNNQQGSLKQQAIFLQKMYTGLQKKKTINSASTACNSTVFELFDEKKVQLASKQKQKALDRFLIGKNQSMILRSKLIQQANKFKEGKGENFTPSEINSAGQTNPTSSTNLIEITKTNKKILQEIIEEMECEQKEYVKQLIDAEQRGIVYTSQFQKMERLIETKDAQLLAYQLIFMARSSLAVSDYDKATYFLQQVKVITDMSKKIAPLKALVFLLLGEVAMRIHKYSEGVKIFKKALQYSWFFNQREYEIQAFEQLGLSYFYLQDIQMSNFYHTRCTKAQFELPNSHIRNISYENIHEYFTKCEYNLNSITPILMVHLNLPVQYSLDKVQQGLRETFLKQEQKNNKRNSKISEKLENLARESQKQVENFVASRQKIFSQSNAVKIIELLMEDREFQFETDTPKQFETFDDTNNEIIDGKQILETSEKDSTQSDMSSSQIQFIPSESVQKKRVWEAPVMRKITYDISKFGPVEDPRPSQRVFEDITKYKLSLDKKIEILQKQKIDINKIMQKVNYLVGNNKKYNAQMNQRVRISHLTPNRYDPLKYNTPYYMIAQIKKGYIKFILQLKNAEQNLKQ